jgi:hypothetical protein
VSFGQLFKGKRKAITIPVLLLAVTYAWPFLAGGVLAFLASKHIPYKKVKIAVIGLIALFAVPFGSIWTAAAVASMTGQPATVTKQEKSVEGVQTVDQKIFELPTATPEPTATITPTPTVTPAPTITPKPIYKPKPTSTPIPVKAFVAIPTPTKAPVIQHVQPATQPIQQAPQTVSSGGDKNCSDFATHAEAQAYFNSKGGSPSNNVDGLDRDHDGIACENNP